MAIGDVNYKANRNPATVREQTAFNAFFALSVGFARFFPHLGGLHRVVHRLPKPVDAFQFGCFGINGSIFPIMHLKSCIGFLFYVFHR